MGGRSSEEKAKRKGAIIFFIMGIILILIGIIMNYRNEATRGKAGGRGISTEVEITGTGAILIGIFFCLSAVITRISKSKEHD